MKDSLCCPKEEEEEDDALPFPKVSPGKIRLENKRRAGAESNLSVFDPTKREGGSLSAPKDCFGSFANPSYFSLSLFCRRTDPRGDFSFRVPKSSEGKHDDKEEFFSSLRVIKERDFFPRK